MMDLIKLGERTYCIISPVNVGIYKINNNDVCLIDTGNSKDFGKIIEKVLIDNNWNLKCIINTHSHADHIGGNKYLQSKYGCDIFANLKESYFINETLLEPAMLYSGNPPKDMLNHFLKADESTCSGIDKMNIEGLKIINLEGHSVGQIGVVTSDNVCFCGDAYTSEKIIKKYAIQYVYDIEKYLDSLRFLKETNYKYYVPSHGEIEENCKNTIDANINNIQNLENEIYEILRHNNTYSKLLTVIFERHHIKLNIIQYHLLSATIKSFLTKLEKEGKIKFEFNNNDFEINSI
ncbi:MAG: MBL fold metallo-hydrolase [Firmicutes bacterium]|nr:MBL fold metallo-hydrolase [Bacillota bacterium]